MVIIYSFSTCTSSWKNATTAVDLDGRPYMGTSPMNLFLCWVHVAVPRDPGMNRQLTIPCWIQKMENTKFGDEVTMTHPNYHLAAGYNRWKSSKMYKDRGFSMEIYWFSFDGGMDQLSPRFCALVRVYDPRNVLVEALDVIGSPIRNNKKPSNTFSWTLW